MAKQKFYVIWRGHHPGIYTDWPTAQKQILGFSNARYKSFKTRAEAEEAFALDADHTPRSSRPNDAEGASLFSTDYTFFCDGGCEPNPGEAGSGIAIYKSGKLIQLWYGQYTEYGTNNSAELHALYQSMFLAEKVFAQGKSAQIYCDSMYAIQCVRDWASGWEKRGWKRKGGEILNLELIKRLYALYTRLKPKLILTHVKAHAGTEGNELADRMTMVAIDRHAMEWCKYETDETGAFDITALLKMRSG